MVAVASNPTAAHSVLGVWATGYSDPSVNMNQPGIIHGSLALKALLFLSPWKDKNIDYAHL